jgi:hypothetical protein
VLFQPINRGISTVQPPLSQAVGYVVVVVIGVIIALGEYFKYHVSSTFCKSRSLVRENNRE